MKPHQAVEQRMTRMRASKLIAEATQAVERMAAQAKDGIGEESAKDVRALLQSKLQQIDALESEVCRVQSLTGYSDLRESLDWVSDYIARWGQFRASAPARGWI